MKKRFVLFVSTFMLAAALTGCGVEQTNDTITHEAGQELKIDATTCFDINEKKAADFTFDTSKVDVNTVGEYEVTATYKSNEYTLTVNVVDTTAPMVTFASRCVFTNDLENTDFTNALEGIYDASEYTTKLIRFEKYGNLEVMDENAVKALTDKIPVPCDKDELMAVGTEEVPTEAGIYRSVLEVKDVHDNSVYEEVYVVYDTMGARIEDVPDKTVKVEKEDLDKEPEIDKSDYTITDNVDGKISSEDIVCELELRDGDKHEWLVHVSYTDRAGNDSKADFLIIVKEKTSAKKEETKTENKTEDTTASSSSSNTATGSVSTGAVAPNPSNPADADGDGEVSEQEAAANVSPSEQAVMDAGYGVVVLLPTGNYGVLTPESGYVNGLDGFEILDNYLFSLGLKSTNMSGGYIGSWSTDMMFIARDVTAIPQGNVDENGFLWVN